MPRICRGGRRKCRFFFFYNIQKKPKKPRKQNKKKIINLKGISKAMEGKATKRNNAVEKPNLNLI